MRKSYLDNLRWVTVVLVVIYHVFYMYNAEGIAGTLGKITNLDVQYYDVYQYIVYPWFMLLLFIVSGASARYALDKRPARNSLRAGLLNFSYRYRSDYLLSSSFRAISISLFQALQTTLTCLLQYR